MIALFGPSGCGKTSLLRCLAGLESITSGEIFLMKRRITNIAPERRPVVLMFQDPFLFPHMTVMENIMFGLKQQKLTRKKRMEITLEMLIKTEMDGYKDSFPHSLSGGQQQRVAIARALVTNPALLLLDESFSSLDQHLKEILREWVCSFLKKEGVTTILVTHDKEEAMMIGDRVILLKDGSIQQQGKPNEVYQYPENKNVEEMFSDGLEVDGIFVPSQHLRIVPLVKEYSEEIIGQGYITSYFFKYGLCFYQIRLSNRNQQIVLHSKRDYKVGNKVLICKEGYR